MMRNDGRRPGDILKWVVAIALLIASAGQFYIRGARQMFRDGSDLYLVRLASRAWLNGENPYDCKVIERIGDAEGKYPGPALDAEWHRSVYPPQTYMLVSPLAMMKWETARLVWSLGNLVLLGTEIAALVVLAPRKISGQGALGLIAILLLIAPIGTGMSLGQLSLAVTALCVLAMANWRRPILAGILISMATCLKPQIGGVFLIYLMVRLPWRASAGAIGTMALVSLASVVRLMHLSWFGTWMENTHATMTPGGIASLSGEKAVRVTLTQLQYPLSVLTGSAFIASTVAWAVAIVLMAILIAALRKNRRPVSELLPIAAITMVSFIPMYHRNYDLVVLALPVAWAVYSACGPMRIHAWVTIALVVGVISVNPINVETFGARHFSESFQNGLLWRGFVSRYLNWGVAILGVWLTYAVWRESPRGRLATERPVVEDRMR